MQNEAYRKKNESFRKQVVFRIGINAGFFSEYNNMILSMLYCLNHQIRFKLCSKNANFDPVNGWEGFFEPFCEEADCMHTHYKTANWRYATKQLLKGNLRALKNFIPYFTFWKKNLYTQDIFGKARDIPLRKQFNIPELRINGDIRQACSRLIGLTWKYNTWTQLQVDAYRSSLHLPSEYIGMHIRGGDKFEEADILQAEQYMQKAISLSDLKHAFILTDDYTIIERLYANYPDWKFYTLCSPEERGYYYDQFMNEGEKEKRDRTIKLFSSIDILAEATFFIGTYSSNPGMYLGMRMPAEKVFGIDFPHWRIW